MLARELVELAALAASHGPALIASPGRISAGSLEQYWSASKTRLERWHRALKSFSVQAHSASSRAEWLRLEAVLEELFIAEILTRVWTGVLVAYDAHRGAVEAEPVARSVFQGHVEVRTRAMRLLVKEAAVPVDGAVAVNRLRRRCERWTDTLLSYLLATFDVREFAFDPSRVADFADDLAYQRERPGGQYLWPLTMVSLRGAFQRGLCSHSPNADANARVASSILACFPPEVFDGTGQFQSMWLMRLTSNTADAQGMIEELLGPARPTSSGPLSAAPRLLRRRDV